MKRARLVLLSAVCLVGASVGLAGCGDDQGRVPTKAESQAADVKRQSYIDSLPNLSPEQKARMKAQMGGPAVESQADKAKADADHGKPTGR